MKQTTPKTPFVPLIASILVVLILLGGCTYKTPENPNTFARTILVNGMERTYRIHVPPELPQNLSPALVFILHGGGGTAEGMERSLTLGGFNTLADRYQFIVVYPDGIGKGWNDGRKNMTDPAHQQHIDDVGFFSLLIDNLTQEFNIDTKKIFVTGISNGAMMSYRLALELPEKIAAIAPVAGAIPTDLLPFNMSQEPVSVCAISGTKDPLVPWDGGVVYPRKPRGTVISVNDSVMFWVAHDQCSSIPFSIDLPNVVLRDLTRVHEDVYQNGTNDSAVVLYTIINGGHTWPGGQQYLPKALVGRTCRDIDANTVIWDFFSTHPKPAGD
jgi:polyhydroxybutyrate depolymerase